MRDRIFHSFFNNSTISFLFKSFDDLFEFKIESYSYVLPNNEKDMNFRFCFVLKLYVNNEGLLLLPNVNDDIEESSSVKVCNSDIDVHLSCEPMITIDDSVKPDGTSKISSYIVPVRKLMNQSH